MTKLTKQRAKNHIVRKNLGKFEKKEQFQHSCIVWRTDGRNVSSFGEAL